jgi:uncharacterized protein
VQAGTVINRQELRRYLSRLDDRWQIEAAMLGGARVADERGESPSSGAPTEFVLVLVSSAFDGIPWLERVHQAAALWDAREMDGKADVHCYTPAEFERKRETLSAVRAAAENGLDLLALS